MSKPKIAVFPGSFDPFTVGHESIVRRAIPLFDKIVIGIGYNSNKKSCFSIEKRKAWIEQTFEDEPKIDVAIFEGLTVAYCQKINAQFILRGLRTSADFEYERAIGQVNKAMFPEIETVFLLTRPEHTAISSSIVREIVKHGGDASQFVPDRINLNDC